MKPVTIIVAGTPQGVWKDDAGWYYANEDWHQAHIVDENGNDVTVTEKEHLGAHTSTAEATYEWRYKLYFDPEHPDRPVQLG